MKFLYFILFILLTGCATTQEVQKVYIPVTQKCYDKPIPDKPDLFVDTMKGDEKINVIINGYQSDIYKLEVYSDTLKTFICK
jgi:hypothetical protein